MDVPDGQPSTDTTHLQVTTCTHQPPTLLQTFANSIILGSESHGTLTAVGAFSLLTCALGPHCIASGQNALKTPPSMVPLSLRFIHCLTMGRLFDDVETCLLCH
jgi:hypothetical protein